MGITCNYLVAPAILLNTPGLTREEFAEKLKEVHHSMDDIDLSKPWNYVSKYEEEDLRRGLYSVAMVLGLEITKKFKEFSKVKKRGLEGLIFPPYLRFEKNSFKVVVHKGNKILKEVKTEVEEDVREGDFVYSPPFCDCHYGLIKKVLKKYEYKDDIFPDLKTTISEVILLPFFKVEEEIIYKTEEELWKDWPQFHPDFMFDWNKEKGFFHYGGKLNVLWKKIGNKYYIDEKTFKEMLYVKRNWGSRFTYTDLKITEIAIKYKAWQLLYRNGFRHLEEFFKDFPQAKKEYEKAIWDWYSSAINKDKTVKEFLHWRLLCRVS